jgi:hypothetical protein
MLALLPYEGSISSPQSSSGAPQRAGRRPLASWCTRTTVTLRTVPRGCVAQVVLGVRVMNKKERCAPVPTSANTASECVCSRHLRCAHLLIIPCCNCVGASFKDAYGVGSSLPGECHCRLVQRLALRESSR